MKIGPQISIDLVYFFFISLDNLIKILTRRYDKLLRRIQDISYRFVLNRPEKQNKIQWIYRSRTSYPTFAFNTHLLNRRVRSVRIIVLARKEETCLSTIRRVDGSRAPFLPSSPLQNRTLQTRTRRKIRISDIIGRAYNAP